jgi:pimeloyl-ACP methyl ester carboxylesterase
MCDDRLWRHVDFGTRPVVHADLTLDDRVEAMAERVLGDAPERFVAVGFSMGGIVALSLSSIAGPRMVGLALVDTNAAADLPKRAEARLRHQAAVRAGRLREVVAQELKPNYFSSANANRRDILDLTMTMALELGPDVFLRQSEALRHAATTMSCVRPCGTAKWQRTSRTLSSSSSIARDTCCRSRGLIASRPH